MFAVIYRWDIDPEKRELFEEAWSKMTEAIQEKWNTGGSRLHYNKDLGCHVAYAVWPSQEAWESFDPEDLGDELLDLRITMGEAIKQSYAVEKLEFISDKLSNTRGF